ncbi:hypothetical protein [Bradyrhizobium sp. Bra64]|uniref:hypothetical protein n=1 Tax=Bradyrhizobium sp. Bra64 TaxID=2926009 RepID=UPI0021176FF4
MLEHQVIPQDISRRALSQGFAREQERACGAEHHNNESATMVPSRRMTPHGIATDFLASRSAHNGPLLRACSALKTILNDQFTMVGSVDSGKAVVPVTIEIGPGKAKMVHRRRRRMANST